MDVTVITATTPERKNLLHQLGQSIALQQRRPFEWIVATDREHVGPAPILNELAERVETTWLFRCDDDDLFDRNHFATIEPWLTDDWDIVYTWPRIDPPGHFEHPAALQGVRPLHTLRERNWIASAAAVRTSVWKALGGLREVPDEDWDLWLRALDMGCRFRCVPEVTWTYRMGDWEHRSTREEATR